MLSNIAEVFLYSLIVFLVLIILTRIIGYKLLSQITFSDFVIGITIGTIAGAFVTTEIRGFYVLLGPVFLTLFVMILDYFTMKNVPFRKLIEGDFIDLREDELSYVQKVEDDGSIIS